jgi:hypothetical protein
MAKKSKTPSPLEGRWRITSMEMWAQDFVDAEVEGYFEFGPQGRGSFQFGYVRDDIDYREGSREGQPRIEWSWDGNDEMGPASGRGWAVRDGDEIHGVIAFHQGDQSAFVAKKQAPPRPKSERKKR